MGRRLTGFGFSLFTDLFHVLSGFLEVARVAEGLDILEVERPAEGQGPDVVSLPVTVQTLHHHFTLGALALITEKAGPPGVLVNLVLPCTIPVPRQPGQYRIGRGMQNGFFAKPAFTRNSRSGQQEFWVPVVSLFLHFQRLSAFKKASAFWAAVALILAFTER